MPGGKPFLYVSAVLGVGLLMSSIYETFLAAEGGVPPEWIVLGAWAAIGLFFFRMAAPMRAKVSESEMRWLILNEKRVHSLDEDG